MVIGLWSTLTAMKTLPHDYKLIKTIPLTGKYLTTDFLKSAYVINQKNQVLKYDSTGAAIGIYNENRYGQLHTVDATTPFKVLMFYKDQSTIVTTDFQMNPKHLYRLSSVGINRVATACMSHDQYIWVYDMEVHRLKKINTNYEVIYQSQNVKNLLGMEVEPNFMIERDGLIYLNVPGEGVIMFDIFGTYYTSASITDLGKEDLKSFQVVNNNIVFFEDGILHIFNVFEKMRNDVRIPQTDGTKDVKVEMGYLYLLNNEELRFYSLGL